MNNSDISFITKRLKPIFGYRLSNSELWDDNLIRIWVDTISREELKLLYNFCIDYSFNVELSSSNQGIVLDFSSR